MKINKILLSVLITIIGLSLVACGSSSSSSKEKPTASVGTQQGAVFAEAGGEANFTVTTANIEAGTDITLVSPPAGITLKNSPVKVTGNSTPITIVVAAATVESGIKNLTIAVGDITASFTLTVSGADDPVILTAVPTPASVAQGGTVNVAITTANVANGANITLTAATGFNAAAATITDGAGTLVITVANNAPVGTASLTVNVAGVATGTGVSFTVTQAGAKKVTVSEQVGGFAAAGQAGAAYFVVETESIAADSAITLKSTVAGTSLAAGSVVSNITGTQFVIEIAAAITAGVHDLQITVDGTDSNLFELTVGNTVDKFNLPFWNGWPGGSQWAPGGNRAPDGDGKGTKTGTTPAASGNMANIAPVMLTLDANLDNAWGVAGISGATNPITGAANAPNWGWRGMDPGDYTAAVIKLGAPAEKDFVLLLQYTLGDGADNWNDSDQRLVIKAGETEGFIAIDPAKLAASINVADTVDKTEKRMRIMVASYNPDNDLPAMDNMDADEIAAHIADDTDLFDINITEFALLRAKYEEPTVEPLYDMSKDTNVSRFHGSSQNSDPTWWLVTSSGGTGRAPLAHGIIDFFRSDGAAAITGTSQPFRIRTGNFNTQFSVKAASKYRFEFDFEATSASNQADTTLVQFRISAGNVVINDSRMISNTNIDGKVSAVYELTGTELLAFASDVELQVGPTAQPLLTMLFTKFIITEL